MPAEIRPLPVTVEPVNGEVFDGYLERLAAANDLDHPRLLRRFTSRSGSTVTFLPIAANRQVLEQVAAATGLGAERLRSSLLSALPGIDVDDLDTTDPSTWRRVAARGWAPQRGSAVCPACLAADGIWKLAWRHPWVTTCGRHRVWLVACCPTCGQRFRHQCTPLYTVDAVDGTCGNPDGARGRTCPQPLLSLPVASAPAEVLAAQQHIRTALDGHQVHVLDDSVNPDAYLAEIKALTVLLLHLAIQPGGGQVADWADAARADHNRSSGDRGARWGLVPPADLQLRGQTMTAADQILCQPTLDAAAEALHPWAELTPRTNEGQLGWLADHTAMTPTLTRLVMAATATRRRLATLLDTPQTHRLPLAEIPQVLPIDLYRRHLSGMLAVTEPTGRLFATLCLARRYCTATWADAATALGLPDATGTKTARACSADLTAPMTHYLQAIDDLAVGMNPGVDYRSREDSVRQLTDRSRWYRRWARNHHPGSHATSKRYAVAWLWTEYAHGHLSTSPSWKAGSPDAATRARYRRYVARLTPAATSALRDIAAHHCPRKRSAA